MKHARVIGIVALWTVSSAIPVQPAVGQDNAALVRDVIKTLNKDDSIAGTEESKSYRILFDAYLELTTPPFPIGPNFNLNTIHPKMSQWDAVSAWAESNTLMAEAIVKCKDKNIIGLPYGTDTIDSAYVNAGLIAEVGVDGSLRNIRFPYISAVDTIAAYVTAEVYRLMETGESGKALNLAAAHMFVLRQYCDREFRDEKLHSIELLSDALSNMRDVFYLYQDKITAEQYSKVALLEIPYLRPDRSRLFMPEADRIVSEALIQEVFDGRTGQANPEKFTSTFAGIQSQNTPLTRFGAAKRWARIARLHGSLDASLDRLKLIYDDWWRRWRIDAYDDLLEFDTQFERTNSIRYAAVIYSIEDVEVLFGIRNQLIAEVNGTAIAAGLCGYRKRFGTYPDQTEKTYTQFIRRRSDSDPYDKELRPFKYRLLSSRQSVDTPLGRVWVNSGEGLLYSQGQDNEDNRGADHTDDGVDGDIVLWPPMKVLGREAGLLD